MSMETCINSAEATKEVMFFGEVDFCPVGWRIINGFCKWVIKEVTKFGRSPDSFFIVDHYFIFFTISK